jgi:hemolysin III
VIATEGAVEAPTTPIPLLRGWLHLACFFLAIPAGWAVVSVTERDVSRLGAIVYAATVAALFGVSGTYHRQRWTPPVRRRLKRLDHATIFLMIAGTYTPVCVSALGGTMGVVLLIAVWTGAIAGVVLSVTAIAERRVIGIALYIALGWLAAVALPQLARRLSAEALVLLVVGGVLFTAGAIFLAARWPDPLPRIFGYHEVWHLMVVAAVVCHYLAVRSVLQSAG